MEKVSLQKVSEDVEVIKKAVLAMQEYFEDTHLTTEEVELVEESFKNEKEGKLISHEELKAELGL